jgi:dihydroorotase
MVLKKDMTWSYFRSNHGERVTFSSITPKLRWLLLDATVLFLWESVVLKMSSNDPIRLEIRVPDDFHHHCRDGVKTNVILKFARERFGRILVMPNLHPPVTTTEDATRYRNRLLEAQRTVRMLDKIASKKTEVVETLELLMTLYLTDATTPEEIQKAAAAGIVGCKYYPAGATTNSAQGVTDVKLCYPALHEMSRLGMMLCIHSEVTHADIFDREPVFIEEVMKPLVRDFPDLKITMEHISTKEAVDYVLHEAPDNVKATITCHHLLYNRNHLLVGGIRPHLYCLPILKAEEHRQALLVAATSGSPKFFLGTDSAPHAISAKETECGCAGVFTAHAAVELYAEAFEQMNALDKLEDFCSSFGADHYGIPRSTETIILEKKPWTVPADYDFGEAQEVRPLRFGEEIQWTLVKTATGASRTMDKNNYH